jgi:hypothetical protein
MPTPQTVRSLAAVHFLAVGSLELWGLIAVVVGVVASALLIRPRSERRRIDHLAKMASLHGLRYSGTDSADSYYQSKGFLSSALPLMRANRKTAGQGVRHMLVGRWNGHEVAAFEYWHEEAEGWTSGGSYEGSLLRVISEFLPSKNEDLRSGQFTYFSCAIVEIPAFLPSLSLSRENSRTRLEDRLGRKDVGVGDDLFDKTFEVTCEDAEFAGTLFDERLRDWLSASRLNCDFQLGGDKVLAFQRGKLTESNALSLLEAVVGFNSHIRQELLRDHPPKRSRSPTADPRAPRVEIFREDFLKWRWRRLDQNGNQVATSPSSYMGPGGARISARQSNPDLQERQFVVDGPL